jgi:cold shock protein
MSEKQIGTVKWYNDKKGFGIIKNETKETFVHYSQIQASTSNYKKLQENEEVEFEIGTDKNGRECAINVCAPNGAKLLFEQ